MYVFSGKRFKKLIGHWTVLPPPHKKRFFFVVTAVAEAKTIKEGGETPRL